MRSPYRDGYFLLFVLLCCSYAVMFFQLFSTLPLYWRRVYDLPEGQIGLLMALNGLIVFLLEMIVVYLIGDRVKKQVLVAGGLLFMGLSFVLLNMMQHLSVLYLAMLLLSISEIFAMPFMATITVERSTSENRGAYMGLYTISYAAAHVIAPFLGTTIIATYSFATLWWATGILSVLTAIGLYWVVQKLESDRRLLQSISPADSIELSTA